MKNNNINETPYEPDYIDTEAKTEATDETSV